MPCTRERTCHKPLEMRTHVRKHISPTTSTGNVVYVRDKSAFHSFVQQWKSSCQRNGRDQNDFECTYHASVVVIWVYHLPWDRTNEIWNINIDRHEWRGKKPYVRHLFEDGVWLSGLILMRSRCRSITIYSFYQNQVMEHSQIWFCPVFQPMHMAFNLIRWYKIVIVRCIFPVWGFVWFRFSSEIHWHLFVMANIFHNRRHSTFRFMSLPAKVCALYRFIWT